MEYLKNIRKYNKNKDNFDARKLSTLLLIPLFFGVIAVGSADEAFATPEFLSASYDLEYKTIEIDFAGSQITGVDLSSIYLSSGDNVKEFQVEGSAHHDSDVIEIDISDSFVKKINGKSDLHLDIDSCGVQWSGGCMPSKMSLPISDLTDSGFKLAVEPTVSSSVDSSTSTATVPPTVTVAPEPKVTPKSPFAVTGAVWDMGTDILTVTFSNGVQTIPHGVFGMHSGTNGNGLVIQFAYDNSDENILVAKMHPDSKTTTKHSGLKLTNDHDLEILDYDGQVATNIHNFPVRVINAPDVTVEPEPTVTLSFFSSPSFGFSVINAPDVTVEPEPTVTPDVTAPPPPTVTPPPQPPTYTAEIVSPEKIKLTFDGMITATPDVYLNFYESVLPQGITITKTEVYSDHVMLIVSNMDVHEPVTVTYSQHDSSNSGIVSYIEAGSLEVPDGYTSIAPALPRVIEPVTETTDTATETIQPTVTNPAVARPDISEVACNDLDPDLYTYAEMVELFKRCATSPADKKYFEQNGIDIDDALNGGTGIIEPVYTIEDAKADMAAKKKSGGGGNDYNSRPTFGKSHQTQKQIIEDGFSFNGYSLTITDNWHTDFVKTSSIIGEQNHITAKMWIHNPLKEFKLSLGIPEIGDRPSAESEIVVALNRNYQNPNDYDVMDITYEQDEPLVNEHNTRAAMSKVKCTPDANRAQCVQIDLYFTVDAPLKHDVLAITAMDDKRRVQTTYLNEGVEFTGESLLDPATGQVWHKASSQDKGEYIYLTQPDRRFNSW